MAMTLPIPPNGTAENTVAQRTTQSPCPSFVTDWSGNASLSSDSTTQLQRPSIDRDASIIFTGPRGSGKSSLAVLAGLLLRRHVVDADEYRHLAKTAQIPNGDALKRKRDDGDEPHRDRRAEWTKALLTRYSKGFVIACGPALAMRGCREFIRTYAKTHPIIYVRSCDPRDATNPETVQEAGQRGAKDLPERVQEVLNMCHRLSNYDFFNLPERWKDAGDPSAGEKSLKEALPHRNLSTRQMQALQRTQASLASFLASALGYDASSLSHTIFPTLYPRLPQHRVYSNLIRVRLSNKDLDIFKVSAGADAVEIVNDIWQSSDDEDAHLERLTQIVAEIRRHLQVPVVYHVELEPSNPLQSQDDRDSYLTVLYQGLRLAPEYLTINLRTEDAIVSEVCRHSGYTTIVGHHEHMNEEDGFWASPVPRNCYLRAVRMGCDVVRIVKGGRSVEEDYHCLSFSAKIASVPDTVPIIAYNIGETGHLSRVCNSILSPVVDDSPGNTNSCDMTIRTRWSTLFSLRLLDPLRFFVFGASVSHSMSPAMHNVAFNTLGMSHTYETRETTVLEDLPSFWNDPNFGGASISLPFKKSILRYVRHHSPSVEMIGAANTILPIRSHSNNVNATSSPPEFRSKDFRHKAGPVLGLYADNTDWMGICACLSRSISPANTINRETVGLVIGAGGMARAAVYGLLYLGVRNVYIYNRTPSRAKTLATHFQQVFANFASSKSQNTTRKPGDDNSTTGFRITTLESVHDQWPAGEKPPSIVICAIKAHKSCDSDSPPFILPPSWMGSPTGGVIVELTFYAPETHLMKQFREQKPRGWTLVDPIEVFHSQACTQFEIFTGSRAPAGVMRDACLHDYVEKMKQGIFNQD